MIKVRKVDFTGQVITGILTLLSLLTFSFYFFFIGTATLGIWQLMSALINTWSMFQTIYALRILLYWALTAIALIMLFLGDEAMVISMFLSWAIAIYYLFIYRSFIKHLAFRKELSTLIK